MWSFPGTCMVSIVIRYWCFICSLLSLYNNGQNIQLYNNLCNILSTDYVGFHSRNNFIQLMSSSLKFMKLEDFDQTIQLWYSSQKISYANDSKKEVNLSRNMGIKPWYVMGIIFRNLNILKHIPFTVSMHMIIIQK